MGIKLLLVEKPIKNGNPVLGLENIKAVEELKELLDEPDLQNAEITIPKKDSDNFPAKIQNNELRNFLNDHNGKKLFVLSTKHSSTKKVNFNN